jgi:ABC-type transport system substrate-binding protein
MRIAGSLALIVAGLALGAAAWAQRPAPFVLRVASEMDLIDPAIGYSWNAEYATCLKLVNIDDRGNLVPEAAPFPRISKDGRTYTFTVKHGFRFYPWGGPLTAAAFAWEIRRVISPRMLRGGRAYLQDLVGAPRAEGMKLTLKLTQSAPDLLARLAMPFFCAVPDGTPIEPDGVGTPLPSAGPYYFAEWKGPNGDVVLRRNPYYHGPRPHRPDEIVIRSAAYVTPKLQQAAVEAGALDVGTPADRADLAARYGVNRGRFRVEPLLNIRWLEFDPQSAVFRNNPELRRAIGYALDRRALERAWGPFAGRPTARLIPPGVPGFAKPAPYPLDGPDLARARAIAQGHLPDHAVTLGVSLSSTAQAVGEELKSELAAIGLDVEVSTIPSFGPPRPLPRYDLTIGGWSVDYFDPQAAFAVFETPGDHWPTLDPAWRTRLASTERTSGSARLQAFARLDYDLMQTDPPVIPFMADNTRVFLSARIRCFRWNRFYGVDLAALCTSATTGK